MDETQTKLANYAETQIEQISPLRLASNDLLSKAQDLQVVDAEGAKEALALRKEVLAHVKSAGDLRMSFTRQLDAVKTQFIDAERKALEPAEEAKKLLGDKILSYEQEVERKRQAELKRRADLVETLLKGATPFEVDQIETEDALKQVADALKGRQAQLAEADQKLPEIVTAISNAAYCISEKLTQLRNLEANSIEARRAEIERNKEMKLAEKEVKAAEQQQKAAAEETVKTGSRVRMTFVITDPSQVPRELCEPSEKLIREYINLTGAETLAGVEIKRERTL